VIVNVAAVAGTGWLVNSARHAQIANAKEGEGLKTNRKIFMPVSLQVFGREQ